MYFTYGPAMRTWRHGGPRSEHFNYCILVRGATEVREAKMLIMKAKISNN
jgi:hypothetical protein